MRAALRRGASGAADKELVSNDISLDLVSRKAFRGAEEMQLTPREFTLLATLIRNIGAVLTRDLLLAVVWGDDYVGDPRTVDVHIRWLREKIEQDPSDPERIRTVRGVGYRFEG